VDELRLVIVVACIITALIWYMAGRRSKRFRISRWAVMLIPVFRFLFYIVVATGLCADKTLNIISSALILQTLITLCIWGWMVVSE